MYGEHSAKCLACKKCLINVSNTYCYQVIHMTSHSLILCPRFFELLKFLCSKLPLVINHIIDLIATHHKNKEIITYKIYGKAVSGFDGLKCKC